MRRRPGGGPAGAAGSAEPDPAARRAVPAHASTTGRRSSPGARSLRRARLGLLVAAGLAGALAVTQLPVGELLGQRSQIDLVTRQLSVIDQRNAALRAEDAALLHPSTIAAIAHEDYGLVRPGERAYVILPHAGDEGTLGRVVLPTSELVAGSATAITGIGPPGVAASRAVSRGREPLLERTLSRLEFWRWAF